MNETSVALLRELHQEVVGDPHLIAALEQAKLNQACLVCASGNAGDGLIHLGAFSLLKSLDWSPRIISERGLAEEADGGWAVMVGGAMIEGVWDERMRAIRGFLERGGRLVMLPCTILGFQDLLRQYAGQLIVFAREKDSFENVRAAGVDAHLRHDLAFVVPPSFYQELVRDDRAGELRAFRTDEERSQAEIPFGNLDLSLLWNGDLWRDPDVAEERCRLLGRMLATFETVATDRLHIGIFAAALNCRVRLSRSLGGKIAGVYEQTLKRFPNVELAPEAVAPDGEWRPRDKLLESAAELARLRRDYYEPEIARLNDVIGEQDKIRREWFEPELERRRQAAEDREAARRAAAGELVSATQRIEELRREMATHQRQTLFYARELTDATAREKSVQTEQFAQQSEQLTLQAEQLALQAEELRQLRDRIEQLRPPSPERSGGVFHSIRRSLEMIGYVVFPLGKQRWAKRRKMLAALSRGE